MLPLPQNYTQLQPEDRVTLASLKQQSFSIRAIARMLNRSASTTTRKPPSDCTANTTGVPRNGSDRRSCSDASVMRGGAGRSLAPGDAGAADSGAGIDGDVERR